MAYGKLIGAKLFEAPNILNKDGKQYINPPESVYLELGYFPVQYLYLSSNYSNIWSLIVIGISFIFGIIKLKREDFYFLKNYEFYFIVICMFIVFKIIPGVDSGDEVFYIPYIIDNSKGLVNVIDPYVGLDGTIDIYHYFRGIYFIPSLLYRIQSLITNSVSNGFIVYRSTFSLLFSIYSPIF